MLQTVCSDDDCYVTTILNTLATVVTTVDGVLTTYVTASPITVVYNDATTSTVPHSKSTASSHVAAASPSSGIASQTSSATTIASTGSTVTKQTSLHGAQSASQTLGASAASNDFTSALTSASESTRIVAADSKISSMPLSASETLSVLGETVTNPHTTVLTITTCSDNKCQATSVTTGLTVVTTTVDGVKTVYTTFCPLTSQTESTAIAAKSTVTEVPETESLDTTTSDSAATPGSTSVVNTKSSISTSLSTGADKAASGVVTRASVETGSLRKTDAKSDNSIQSTPITSRTAESIDVIVSSSTPLAFSKTANTNADFKSSDSHTTRHTTVDNGNESVLEHIQTTVVTVTSCSENKCSAMAVTTGLSYSTSTVSGTETILTTYCPLTVEGTSDTATAAPSDLLVTATNSVHDANSLSTSTRFPSDSVLESHLTSKSVVSSVSSALAQGTVNVITNNIITQARTSTAETTIASTARVSSYEGHAARAVPAALALPLLYLIL